MNTRLFRLTVLALTLTSATSARAQIYVGYAFQSYTHVTAYSSDGSTVEGVISTGHTFDSGLAVSGSNLFLVSTGTTNGSIREFDPNLNSVSDPLISGLSSPGLIAASGSNLFVVNSGNGTLGEYTTAGGTVNSSLITGLNSPTSITIAGSDIFVLNSAGTVNEYTTSGDLVNADLISGLSGAAEIAASNTGLFVTEPTLGLVAKYSFSGQPSSTPFLSGLNSPSLIASDGSDIFVATSTNDYVSPLNLSEYDENGSNVFESLVEGGGYITGLAVAPVSTPEPSSWVLLLICIGLLEFLRQRRGRSRLASASEKAI